MASTIDDNGPPAKKNITASEDEDDRKRHRECVSRILKDLEGVKNYDDVVRAVVKNNKFRFRQNSRITDEFGVTTTVWDCSHRHTNDKDYQITEDSVDGKTSSLKFGKNVTGVLDPIKQGDSWVIFKVTDGKVSCLASSGELPDIAVIETDKSGKEKRVNVSELKARGEADKVLLTESKTKAAGAQEKPKEGFHVNRLNQNPPNNSRSL